MNAKTLFHRHFWMILVFLLTACAPGVAPTDDITVIPIQAAAITTPTIQATDIPTLTPTQTQIPTPTPLPFVKLEGLRVAYIIEGNLYIQDSGGQPLQLTNSGEDRLPILSDDGEKVLFFRGAGEKQYRLYGINPDGSQERPLVTGEILASLGLGYDQFAEISDWQLVPGTHKLLFDTQQFKITSEMVGGYSGHWPRFESNQDLLMVNLDTAEITKLNQNSWKERIFQVSPDGKMITDSYSIFDLHGNLIRDLITPLSIWKGKYVFPFWTQDSNRLIILPPIKGNLDPVDGPQPRTIWQYPLDGNQGVETRFYPAPMGSEFSISPNGNWIVYAYYYYPGETDENVPDGIYLGNLPDGSSRLLGANSFYGWPSSFYWSPDSEHFIFSNNRTSQLYLGDVDGNIQSLNDTGFLGWINDKSYLYQKNGDSVAMKTVDDDENVLVVNLLKGIQYMGEGINGAHLISVYINH